MRANAMIWIQRLVAMVFLAGLAALVAAVIILVRQSEGVPPMPIYAGLLGAVALILLAGGCLALISIAGSAKRGADALQRIAGQGRSSTASVGDAETGPQGQDRQPVSETVDDPALPPRPQGKKLVATR